MRYLRLTFLCLVCCAISAVLHAQNVLRVDTLHYPAGKTVILPIALQNQSDLAGVQFDISVPYELKTDDAGQVIIQLSQTRTTTHQVAVSKRGTSWGYITTTTGSQSISYNN